MGVDISAEKLGEVGRLGDGGGLWLWLRLRLGILGDGLLGDAALAQGGACTQLKLGLQLCRVGRAWLRLLLNHHRLSRSPSPPKDTHTHMRMMMMSRLGEAYID